MGCNCKATEYIRKSKKIYGYESETTHNVSTKEKIKMVFKAIFMWIMIIIGFPIIVLYLIFSKTFLRRKKISIFNALKIRI